jgi:hypothetical protein
MVDKFEGTPGTLTQYVKPDFQRTRKNISWLLLHPVHVINRMRKSPTISIWVLFVERGRTFLSMKMTGCSARG